MWWAGSTQRHDVIDALMAGFPAGTLSGAPKVRAMEIIDELEKEKRGPYGGCVGYFSADGEMDSCIVLRTALVKDGLVYVQAGAGIVADSDPAGRAARVRVQGQGALQGRRGGRALRRARQAREQIAGASQTERPCRALQHLRVAFPSNRQVRRRRPVGCSASAAGSASAILTGC